MARELERNKARNDGKCERCTVCAVPGPSRRSIQSRELAEMRGVRVTRACSRGGVHEALILCRRGRSKEEAHKTLSPVLNASRSIFSRHCHWQTTVCA